MDNVFPPKIEVYLTQHTRFGEHCVEGGEYRLLIEDQPPLYMPYKVKSVVNAFACTDFCYILTNHNNERRAYTKYMDVFRPELLVVCENCGCRNVNVRLCLSCGYMHPLVGE